MTQWLKTVVKPGRILEPFLVFGILLGLSLLSHFGYLDLVREALDRKAYAVQFGKYSFTPYDMLDTLITLALIIWVSSIVSGLGEQVITGLPRVRLADKAILTKIVQIFVYFIAFVVALDMLGIDLTAFAVLGGAIGIGLGFGLQKIASNFVSGLILVFEKSMRVGDLVQMTDGIIGYIRHAGARYTRIETFDGKEVMIPNEDFITGRVINWTYSNKKARVEVKVSVSYLSDLERVRQIMLDCAIAHSRCVDDPPPACFVREFGDNGVQLLLLFFVGDVTDGLYGPQSDVMLSIWKKFQEEGIDIPFPQRDMNIRNLKELKDMLRG